MHSPAEIDWTFALPNQPGLNPSSPMLQAAPPRHPEQPEAAFVLLAFEQQEQYHSAGKEQLN
jgi:hypothetical protein